MPVIKNDSGLDLDPIRREVQQYVTLKEESDTITDRINVIKKRLISYTEELGTANEKGSLVLPLGDESTGTVSVVKQRRVSKKFDEDAANSLLKDKGLFDSCTTTVTVLDQDAVMNAYYEGKITDADLAVMFPESVSWALVLEKK